MNKQNLLIILNLVIIGVLGTNQIDTHNNKDNVTLYHYFPHNQHLFQLPDCASQQVCNAVYLRLNFSIPLCACPTQGDPCSASTLHTDGHSLRLAATTGSDKVFTLAKTCEEVKSIRTCDKNTDWSILALQNIRTGKAHYLVICNCPASSFLDGPLEQKGTSDTKVPGIRVYGMICHSRTRYRPKRRKGKHLLEAEEIEPIDDEVPSFPEVPQHMWNNALQLNINSE